jgi:hypothetical protein
MDEVVGAIQIRSTMFKNLQLSLVPAWQHLVAKPLEPHRFPWKR